jgi:hypothetical protein
VPSCKARIREGCKMVRVGQQGENHNSCRQTPATAPRDARRVHEEHDDRASGHAAGDTHRYIRGRNRNSSSISHPHSSASSTLHLHGCHAIALPSSPSKASETLQLLNAIACIPSIDGAAAQQVPPRAPDAVPVLRGHAGRPAPPRPAPPAAAVPGAAAAAARCAAAASAPPDRAGAPRRERGERGRGRLHARPGPAHRPHRQGPARRRGLRPPPPGPLLLRPRRRRLEGLLLRVAVPAHAGDAARHRARLRAPPHRRRPRGAAHPRAGLRSVTRMTLVVEPSYLIHWAPHASVA